VLPVSVGGETFSTGEVIFLLARALPAALTTIATAILGVYNFKEEHVRQGVTHDALRGELAKFLCQAEPYEHDIPNKISLFVLNIRLIISSELEGWRSQFVDQKKAP
jgi:hypothetical protein